MINTYQPSLGLNFCTNTVGVFPSPNGGGGGGGYLGIVNMMAGVVLPDLALHGQILSIAQNTALFSLFGFNFGGNGTTTFALPNLSGETVIGYGQGPSLTNYLFGETDGQQNIQLTQTNLPAVFGGTSIVHEQQPSLALNYAIQIFGIFPSPGGGGGSLNTIGNVVAFADTPGTLPSDYLPCDGRLLAIADYETLFNLIGTTYGGNGQTTFALPDLRGRSIVGLDNNHVIGQMSGSENETITFAQMPTQIGGGGQPIANTHPTIALNYLIALQGIFPNNNGSHGSDTTTPYLGQVITTAYDFVPNGFAQCDGQLLSIVQNQALFALLGTAYGGDGKTTFALPDLRGREAVDVGTLGGTTISLGQQFGSNTNTLTMADIPALNYSGTTSADTLYGANHNDVIHGLAGDDILIGGSGGDLLDGGAGIDTASYKTASLGVTVNLGAVANNTGDAAGDTYVSIEKILGSNFVDHLIAGADGVILDGGAGSDFLLGGLGDDTIVYDAADLSANVDGGGGTDTLLFINDATHIGYNLAAQHFELADLRSVDTTNQPWAMIDKIYDQAWVLQNSTTVNDDSSSSHTDYDYSVGVVYQSLRQDYDATAAHRMTYQYYVFDDNTQRDTTFDFTVGIPYSSLRQDYDATAAHRMTYQYYVFDDNTQRDNTFDFTAAIPYSSLRQDYDATAAHRMTYQFYNFDNGTQRDNSFDFSAAIAYQSLQQDYDATAAHSMTHQFYVFDNGTQRDVSFDNTVAIAWKTLTQNYDATATHKLTDQTYIFDNNTQRYVEYGTFAGHAGATSHTINYDASAAHLFVNEFWS